MHRCAWKVSMWQGSNSSLGNPGCFQARKLLNSQRFSDTIFLMGWKRIPVIFALVTLCDPSHHQTWSQGDLCSPRDVSHVDLAGSLPAWGSWNGTRLPEGPGRDMLLLRAASPSCSGWEQLAPSIIPVKLEQRCPSPAGHRVTGRVLCVCPSTADSALEGGQGTPEAK